MVGNVAVVGDVPAERFQSVFTFVLQELRARVSLDWSVPAGPLEWSCRQTIDHVIDCVFSYAFQLASRARSGFLPFQELHALPDASVGDLVTGLAGAGELFTAILRSAPRDAEASDGLLMLGADDWAARGAYELLVHTHDIMCGLGSRFDPPHTLCSWVLGSPQLYVDRAAAARASNPWEALLVASGRSLGETGTTFNS